MLLLGSSDPSFADDALRYVGGLLIVATIAAACIILVAAIIGSFRTNYRSKIEHWCRTHELQLVSLDRRYLRTGPFFFSLNTTLVFYATVRDSSGIEKHLWIRYGNWMFGMLVPDLHVRTAD